MSSFARMNTNSVPAYAADGIRNPGRPVQLAQGTKVPLRVLVRNLGTEVDFIALSYDAATLTNPGNPGGAPPGGNTYRLPAGQSDAFIVMSGEVLYAIAISGNPSVLCSWAVSEALPSDMHA